MGASVGRWFWKRHWGFQSVCLVWNGCVRAVAPQSILLIQYHGKTKADEEKCPQEKLLLSSWPVTSHVKCRYVKSERHWPRGNGLQADVPWGFSHVGRCFVSEQRPCEAWLAAECLGELMENRLRNKAMVGFCCLRAAAAVGLRAWPALRGTVPSGNVGSHGLFSLVRMFWAGGVAGTWLNNDC